MHPLTAQLMMGVTLAACTGLRATLPLFVLSLLARGGYVTLHPSFAFLAREDTLIVFGVATAIEVLGDKVLGLDHLIDAVGTVVRPVAATVAAGASLYSLDPLVATVLGLVVGGSTAFTVHTGKSVLRVKSSMLAPIHGGVGNAALSIGEDVLAAGGTWLAAQASVIAFIGAAAAVVVSLVLGASAAIGAWRLFRRQTAASTGTGESTRARSDGDTLTRNPRLPPLT